MPEDERILVVDDEEPIRRPLAAYLTANNFRVDQVCNAAEARDALQKRSYDLVVLDIMMPGEDGLSLCRSIRETYQTPTILLSARSEDVERIVGLEMGADDYVTKPFNPRELMARVRAVIRRSLSDSERAPERMVEAFAFGNWRLDLKQQVLIDHEGILVALSTGEFDLIRALLSRPHIVRTREELLSETRGRSADLFDRSIDNMISRLRQKIEDDPKDPKIIKTVWGTGYKLAVDVVSH